METQKNTLADVLMVEVHRGWTRQTGTLADQAGADVPVGTVLAKLAGKYLPINFAASTGAEVAVAVLAEDRLAVDDDVDAVVIARGAVVNSTALVWPAGASTLNKTTALAALEARGIVAQAAV